MRQLDGFLRTGVAPLPDQLVVRGSPNTVAKLMDSARRMASQWTLRGAPISGVSVNVVADETGLSALLQTGAFRTRHHYRRGRVEDVVAAGFLLLPTFADPTHYTIELAPYTEARAQALIDALGTECLNSHFARRRP